MGRRERREVREGWGKREIKSQRHERKSSSMLSFMTKDNIDDDFHTTYTAPQ